jgi:aldose 1-epimerase
MKNRNIWALIALVLLSTAACKKKTAPASEAKEEATVSYTLPNPADFERDLDGKKVQLFILKNGPIQAAVTNYGARMVSLLVPDKTGQSIDVIQGYNSLDAYLKSSEVYFGAVVGRFGNRIAKGKFSLLGKNYTLATNNAPNHLHGGPKGFHAQVWDATQVDESTVELSYLAKEGEEGYPGAVKVTVTYRLSGGKDVEMLYRTEALSPSIANVTNHNFWNLDGERDSSINDHELQIMASSFTAVDSTLIPLPGKPASVSGTPFDFRTPKAVGRDLNQDHIQLKYGGGYDHNFVLIAPEKKDGELPLVASVYGPNSGVKMEVLTNQPGLQFYGGNFLNGKNIGKGGVPYGYRSSLCLETQHFPDSPNRPDFPTTALAKGEVFESKTVYRFSLK